MGWEYCFSNLKLLKFLYIGCINYCCLLGRYRTQSKPSETPDDEVRVLHQGNSHGMSNFNCDHVRFKYTITRHVIAIYLTILHKHTRISTHLKHICG